MGWEMPRANIDRYLYVSVLYWSILADMFGDNRLGIVIESSHVQQKITDDDLWGRMGERKRTFLKNICDFSTGSLKEVCERYRRIVRRDLEDFTMWASSEGRATNVPSYNWRPDSCTPKGPQRISYLDPHPQRPHPQRPFFPGVWDQGLYRYRIFLLISFPQAVAITWLTYYFWRPLSLIRAPYKEPKTSALLESKPGAVQGARYRPALNTLKWLPPIRLKRSLFKEPRIGSLIILLYEFPSRWTTFSW